ncbi:hypothetical protein M3I01_008565 [Marinomonas sp. RSW2]|uniref:Type VI secretion system effector TseH-like domain-containing protein n=1 Tax=Marinomonas maritima TaxID=2940935 RepID=A0ABT5WDT7_9GAMM|nr:hypothetical protein [Marinomonas maritima]MDE8602975.1 hypothetical protein [Marinomonas maritima]
MEVLIPIVFPDYRVTVEVKKEEVDVLPWVTFDNFSFKYKDKISNLGHAGILFINGRSGVTKYYEYGRYDPQKKGIVLKAKNLPDAKVIDGELDTKSIKEALSFISRVSGQSGRISGVYIEVEDEYGKALEYVEARRSKNTLKNRKEYDLLRNSCIHFVKETVEVTDAISPWMVGPRPNSYIGEFRDDYPDLDFYNGKLIIEGVGEY